MDAITLCEHLKTIGSNAFKTTKITKIVIPKSCTSIGANAFEGITTLEEVFIKGDVTIGTGCFNGCTSLTSIVYCGNKDPGRESFFSTTISADIIHVLTTVTFVDFGGISYTKDANVVHNNNLKMTVIDNSLTIDADESGKDGNPIEDTFITESLATNMKCISCQYDTIQNLVIKGGYYKIAASKLTAMTGLLSVTLEGKASLIDDQAFSGCTSLKTVKIDAAIDNYGFFVFHNCQALTDFYYCNDNQPTCIRTENPGNFVFFSSGSTDSSHISYASQVHAYTSSTFADNKFNNECDVIKTANIIMNDNAWFKYEGFVLTINGTGEITSQNIIDTSSNKEKCVHCIDKTHITSATVTSPCSIGISVFEGCTSLKSVTLPPETESIPMKAFKDTILASFPDIPNLATIGESSFENTKLTTVSLSIKVNSIKARAFASCTSLASVSYCGVTDPAEETDQFSGISSLVIHVIKDTNRKYLSNNFCGVNDLTRDLDADKCSVPTYQFTYSYVFSGSKNMEPSAQMTYSQDFSKTENFAFSKDFSNSKSMSLSKIFSISKKFEASKHFSISRNFIETNIFSESVIFERSSNFISSNVFNGTNLFSYSSNFKGTHDFSITNLFLASGVFSLSSEFSISDHYIASEHFTQSSKMSISSNFKETNIFSRTQIFGESDQFSFTTYLSEKVNELSSLILEDEQNIDSSLEHIQNVYFSSQIILNEDYLSSDKTTIVPDVDKQQTSEDLIFEQQTSKDLIFVQHTSEIKENEKQTSEIKENEKQTSENKENEKQTSEIKENERQTSENLIIKHQTSIDDIKISVKPPYIQTNSETKEILVQDSSINVNQDKTPPIIDNILSSNINNNLIEDVSSINDQLNAEQASSIKNEFGKEETSVIIENNQKTENKDLTSQFLSMKLTGDQDVIASVQKDDISLNVLSDLNSNAEISNVLISVTENKANNADQNSGKLSGGQVAGVVIGVMIVIAILIVLIAYLVFRKERDYSTSEFSIDDGEEFQSETNSISDLTVNMTNLLEDFVVLPDDNMITADIEGNYGTYYYEEEVFPTF